MKATKKIIPALVMLLVSAVLLSTASYAWFSMNAQVTATGMQVTAQAPASLLISNTNATTGFGSTVAWANDIFEPAATFEPVAYAAVPTITGTESVDRATNSWFKLTTAAMATINQLGRAVGFTEVADAQPVASFNDTKVGAGEDAPAAYTDGGKNVFHDTVWLKVEGEADTAVTATLAYTSEPSDEIKSAMHVVFVVGGVVVATVDMGTPEELTTVELVELTKNATEGTQVDIYYFLSGNDIDCRNTNISQDASMSINITFNAVDLVP